MGFLRVVMCIICPPLAVIDRGVKALALTTVLTIFGYIPGVAAALVYSSKTPEAI